MAKYIHEFQNFEEYNEGWDNDYVKPWVSLTSNNYVDYNWAPDTNGKNYVDLGLPSGNLWSTSNLPKYFYRWGELEGTTLTATINANTYRWGAELTKYNAEDQYTALWLDDDAANILYGGDWIIPTVEDWVELFNNTTIQSTGSTTVTLKSKIDNKTITLQKYGVKTSTATNSYGQGNGVYGYYWCRKLDSNDISKATHIAVQDSGLINPTNGLARYYGMCIRPIIKRIWKEDDIPLEN